jgi:type II secretory pathway pseudopilin PulG
MKPKLNRKSNGAFTLVEIIGVMAIIGILGAVVAPRVIDGIRDGRVTQLAQNLGQWKSGADRYLQKQQRLPVDASIAPLDPAGQPLNYAQTGGLVSQANATFGDLLIGQGLISAVNVPFGENTFAPLASAPPATLTDVVSTSNPGTYSRIRCVEMTGPKTGNGLGGFSATRTRDYPHRVTFLLIPNVPMQEAAAIKTKIDGPFSGTTISDKTILDDAVAQTTTGSGVLPASRDALVYGNCRVGAGTGETYNLYLYINND